jgi:hypothetical protein
MFADPASAIAMEGKNAKHVKLNSFWLFFAIFAVKGFYWIK